MNKRNFLKSTAAVLATPLLGSFDLKQDQYNKPLSTLKGEALWKRVRQDYHLKEDYINLESGYYNITPKPTLAKYMEHIKRVNLEGSYYMRNNRFKDKDSITEKLANYVCDALDKCGYTYCTGDIMATNPMWRMTRTEWEACFADWIDDPNPKALLNASIFFDLDGVFGQLKWANQLNRFIVKKAKSNSRFLACLARNALNRTPPLGFFKNFVMEKDGRHNNSINLKRRGTAPLADVIRVHALAIGSHSKNSFERLDNIIDANILPKGRGRDLRDALEFISMVRIRHQAFDVENNIAPDNNIEPENLSDFERRNLKDAFQVLSNAQNFLKYRYQNKQTLR